MDKEIENIIQEVEDWGLEDLEELALALHDFITAIREDGER